VLRRGEESALGPVRALWTSKPKTRATVLQMIHGFTQKKKKKLLSRFVRATAPAASHRYRRRSSEPKDLYHKRRVIRRRREAKGTNTCRMVPLKPTFLQYQPSTCKTWEKKLNDLIAVPAPSSATSNVIGGINIERPLLCTSV
jgi:hypothetical protein